MAKAAMLGNIGHGVAVIDYHIKVRQGAQHGANENGFSAQAPAQHGTANGCAKRSLRD